MHDDRIEPGHGQGDAAADAGTGNIAVLARLAGADVETNEIDARRLSLLSLQGFACGTGLAKPACWPACDSTGNGPARSRVPVPHVSTIFFRRTSSCDAIVMNPPFSATTSGTCPRWSRAGTSHGIRGAAGRASAATPEARWTLGGHRGTRDGVGAAHISQMVGRSRATLPRSGQRGHRRFRVHQIRHDVRQPDHRD